MTEWIRKNRVVIVIVTIFLAIAILRDKQRQYPSAKKDFIEELCINNLAFYRVGEGVTQVFTIYGKPISCEFGEENIYTESWIKE